MEKVDESGFFAALVSSKKKLSYTYSVEKVNGEVTEYTDPYAFANVTKPEDYKSFLAGEEKNAAHIFGAHERTVNGVKGVLFTVWAPKALSVSVVGEFNKYDGRVHLMEKLGIQEYLNCLFRDWQPDADICMKLRDRVRGLQES